MERFKKGDKIVAVTSSSNPKNPREAGKTYTIVSVMSCPLCHEEYVCFHIENQNHSYRMRCAGCKGDHIQSNHLWHRSAHFRLATDLKEQLRLALEQENYELAAQLRDKINE
jgi:protein-arginine kinase activator protein McsA